MCVCNTKPQEKSMGDPAGYRMDMWNDTEIMEHAHHHRTGRNRNIKCLYIG